MESDWTGDEDEEAGVGGGSGRVLCITKCCIFEDRLDRMWLLVTNLSEIIGVKHTAILTIERFRHSNNNLSLLALNRL
jgi:hypothetical protein